MGIFKDYINEVNQCVGKSGPYKKTINAPTIEPQQIVDLKPVDLDTKKKKRLKRPDKAERRAEVKKDSDIAQ